MAQLYVGEEFWSDRTPIVTARSKKGNYRSRSEFIETVNAWMDQHNMTYKWAGEHTHEHNGTITYGYDVKLLSGDPKIRTFFLLKWAK